MIWQLLPWQQRVAGRRRPGPGEYLRSGWGADMRQVAGGRAGRGPRRGPQTRYVSWDELALGNPLLGAAGARSRCARGFRGRLGALAHYSKLGAAAEGPPGGDVRRHALSRGTHVIARTTSARLDLHCCCLVHVREKSPKPKMELLLKP